MPVQSRRSEPLPRPVRRSLWWTMVPETSPAEIVARHPGVRLQHEIKPGPGLARNTGVAASTGEILAFIDADCRAHPDWLQSLLQAIRSSPPKTILGGDVRIWRSEGRTLDAIAAYESVFAYRFKLYIEQHGYSGTGNLAMFRQDFEAIGPFAGINVAEDMEWGQRARASRLSLSLRTRDDRISSGAQFAQRAVRQMGPANHALPQHGRRHTRMACSLAGASAPSAGVADHGCSNRPDQRPDLRLRHPLQGNWRTLRRTDASLDDNAGAAAQEQKRNLEPLERFPPDVNQFISGDSLAAANQICRAIIGGGGDGGKGIDGLRDRVVALVGPARPAWSRACLTLQPRRRSADGLVQLATTVVSRRSLAPATTAVAALTVPAVAARSGCGGARPVTLELLTAAR